MKNTHRSLLVQLADTGWIAKTFAGLILINGMIFSAIAYRYEGKSVWEGLTAIPSLPEFRLIAAVVLLLYFLLGEAEKLLERDASVSRNRTVLPTSFMANHPATSLVFGIAGSVSSLILLVACAFGCGAHWIIALLLIYCCAYPDYAGNQYFGSLLDFETSEAEEMN